MHDGAVGGKVHHRGVKPHGAQAFGSAAFALAARRLSSFAFAICSGASFAQQHVFAQLTMLFHRPTCLNSEREAVIVTARSLVRQNWNIHHEFATSLNLQITTCMCSLYHMRNESKKAILSFELALAKKGLSECAFTRVKMKHACTSSIC